MSTKLIAAVALARELDAKKAEFLAEGCAALHCHVVAAVLGTGERPRVHVVGPARPVAELADLGHVAHACRQGQTFEDVDAIGRAAYLRRGTAAALRTFRLRTLGASRRELRTAVALGSKLNPEVLVRIAEGSAHLLSQVGMVKHASCQRVLVALVRVTADIAIATDIMWNGEASSLLCR